MKTQAWRAKSSARWWFTPLCAGWLVLPACSGGDADGSDEAGLEGGTDDAETDSATGGDGDGDGDGDGVETPAPSVRMMRLTHREWTHSVEDLLGIEDATGLATALRADPNQSGFLFDNNYESLSVDEALWNGYRIAAAAAAAQVVDDPTLLTPLFPASSDPLEARAQTFVDSFGPRAFRRPLSVEERDIFVERFLAADPLYPDLEPAEAGVSFTIETMLQSPHFLYQIERSEQVVDGAIPLDAHEVASRMSYFLLDSMPDDALFARAADGGLLDASVRAEEARRLLQTPRGGEVMLAFHELLLKFGSFDSVNPSPAYFPDVSPTLGEDARREAELFVQEIIHADGGSFADLLTSTETHVNAGLAEIYGLAGQFSETEFQRVELDPARRLGLFTRVGYLAHNASSVNPDPIHRGVFLATKMSCLPISAPPDNITPVPPQAGDKTNREMVEEHTENPETVCVQCHKPLINPYGFPFENYDAIGAWRDEDNGKPVDPATEPFIGAGKVPVANASELMTAMSDAPSVHQCYVKHWMEYAFGRNAAPEDTLTYERLGGQSLDEDAAVTEVLVALVSSPTFVARAQEEL